MSGHRTFASVDELIAYLEALGATPSDEGPAFSELEHALQTAALLERAAPDDRQLQVAGLLHDVAHPWDGPGQPRHGVLGAAALQPLYGPRLGHLVEGHVPAKRYLVTVDPDYRRLLSAGSRTTLAAQGEELSEEEVARFAADPDLGALVALRRADDAAKVPGAVVPGLDHWTGALRDLAR